jgi:hypothetical protein
MENTIKYPKGLREAGKKLSLKTKIAMNNQIFD